MDMLMNAEEAERIYDAQWNAADPTTYINDLLNKHGRYEAGIINAAKEAQSQLVLQVLAIEEQLKGEIGKILPFLFKRLKYLHFLYDDLEALANKKMESNQNIEDHFSSTVSTIANMATATHATIKEVFSVDIFDF